MSTAQKPRLKRKRGSALANLPKKAHPPRKIKRASSYHSSSDEDETEPIQNDALPAEIDDEVDGESEVSGDEGVRLPNPDTTATGRVDRKGDIVPGDEDIEAASPEREEDVAVEDAEPASSEADASDADSASDLSDLSEDPSTTSTNTRQTRKRNDPSAFASSISAILGSKLTSTQRSDPILSRSKTASETVQAQSDARLTARAKRKLKEDKRAQLEKGHERDLLGLDKPDVSTGRALEKEKQLRKTAQRGVVKLFNAVMAAQMRGKEGEVKERERGTVGIDKRKEKVEGMGQKAFLDMLAGVEGN